MGAAVQPDAAILGPLSFRPSKMLREKQDGSRRGALVSDILLAQNDKAEHQGKWIRRSSVASNRCSRCTSAQFFFFSRDYRAKPKQRSKRQPHVYLLAFLLIALLSQVLRDDKIVFDNDAMCRCRSRYLIIPSCNFQFICVTRIPQVCFSIILRNVTQ